MTDDSNSSLRDLGLLHHRKAVGGADTKPDYEDSVELNSTTAGSSAASSDDQHHCKQCDEPPQGCSARWTHLIKMTHVPIMKFLQYISRVSARYPERTIAAIVNVSVLLLVVGFFTNFNLFVDENVMWTPANSYPITHSNWIADESSFPKDSRFLVMFFHAEGANVLGQDQVSQVFDAVDTVRNMDGYDQVCQDSAYNTTDGVPACKINGVIQFWDFSTAMYKDTVSSDAEAIADMSKLKYPDETPVVENRVFGFSERDPDTGLLTSAKSYSVVIALPATAQAWELSAVDALLALDAQWAAVAAPLRVEVQAEGSFAEEFTRAVEKDIPLIPVAFVVMSIFTCIVFFRKDRVYSRSLLGFGAVAAVLLSIMTGYGILFIVAVPFTSMTQLLFFIFFGIGLDDAFIIMGSYARTDQFKDAVDRIADTVDDIGLSIFLTTVTSATAFGLGCMSNIPAIYWFCLYTFPTIIFVLLYQLTFFVACIVLDERRISNRRMDCCLCVKAKDVEEVSRPIDLDEDDVEEASGPIDLDEDDAEAASGPIVLDEDTKVQFMDRFMVWYAEKLLIPWVKVLVVVAFTFLVGFAGYSASLFTQEFQFTDVLPSDSYLTEYVEATDKYTAASAARANNYVGVYFRFVKQSDPAIQAQMLNYVNDLVAMDSVQVPPDYFWLPHFQSFVNETGIGDLNFRDQIFLFLKNPVYYNLFNGDLVLDSVGNVIESRTFLVMDNVDLEDVSQQIDALEEQQAVTRAQPVNQGRDDLAFFTYTLQYNMWEIFRVTPSELILTTVVGVAAVTGITALLVPHWSAVVFIFPLICVLYVDLLGVMQWAGLHINGVSYVALVMSIGLLVDYIMHILLRYYETEGNRREKTVDMLRTMGASVLVGGTSTFLGTLPLIFTSCNIFYTLFVAFFGMVTIGVGHGLILLPVILSTFGPEDQVLMSSKRPVRRQHTLQMSGSTISE